MKGSEEMKKQRQSVEQGHKFAGAFFGILIVIALITSCVNGDMFEDEDSYDYEPASTYEEDDYDSDSNSNFDDAVKMLEKELEQERKYGDEWSDNH